MRHTGIPNRAWTRPLVTSLLPAVVLLAVVACGTGDDIDLSAVYDIRLGGDTTAFSTSGNAFELSARNLDNDLRRTFEVGDSFFTQNWVVAPASTEARDGLGPTHNALSCSSCHSHDGRGKPPDHADDPEARTSPSIEHSRSQWPRRGTHVRRTASGPVDSRRAG